MPSTQNEKSLEGERSLWYSNTYSDGGRTTIVIHEQGVTGSGQN